MNAPEKLGKFVVAQELGRGSTGTVYLCHDSFLGKDVAIKVYSLDAGTDEKTAQTRRKLFFNEAYLAGKMNHPNILPIYDAGEDGGHCYVVMEYVRGAQPLTLFCRAGNLLPVRKIVEIIFKCAKALDYAHRKGLVHRDIKPGNIMMTADGDVRIVDFGVAHMAGNDGGQLKGLVGSPSYMAPEQMRQQPSTVQTDLYSLGVVMYELLTGKRPYYGNNLARLVHQIIYATPPPVHTLRADVPPVLEDIVDRSLDKDVTRRYQTGLELATDLTRAVRTLDKLSEELAEQERFNILRRLAFFEDFSYPEVYEVLQASRWQSYGPGESVVTEGELDDCFLVMVLGSADVRRGGQVVGRLSEGDCYGEAPYLPERRAMAGIVAVTPMSVLRVNATLIEQASTQCQLRFHKMFLRALIERLAHGRKGETAAPKPQAVTQKN
ncbi:MAG TPA: serine/threonine-protein kinase [Gammaproteobacteria bacterium]|nr:serine/threonine-protein kinase [Gammaproteobacteria bacterium]